MEIFKRSQLNIDYEGISKEILDGGIFVHPSWEIYKVDEITWDEDPYNDRTWCFYHHSLDMVGHLATAYEKLRKQEYLLKAQELIESWALANPTKEQQKHPAAWKDHSVANRVVNMIHFWYHFKKTDSVSNEFEVLFNEMLKKHGNYLMSDENHTFTNNHGIFQDRSLIALSVLFPHYQEAENWYNISYKRFMQHVKKDVSESGVHLEHSDAYHIIVLKLFMSIYSFLKYHKKNVEELEDIIYQMQEYLAYIYKPDLKIPTNGDSGPDGIGFLDEKDIQNDILLYVKTKGARGKLPEKVKHFKDGGTAIIRNNWLYNHSQLYLRFTAAYHSKVHKHADDLSLLLSIGKTDFLVDSGKYNYKENDSYRKYFRSTMAHNTITVNRQSYPIDNKLRGMSEINKFIDMEHITFVRGEHRLYKNVIIRRSIIYLKEVQSILIYDEIESKRARTYSQIFNIGENVDTVINSKNNILLKSKIDNNKVELLQLNRIPAFKEYEGSNDPIAGWYSDKFNEKKQIKQLRFSVKNESTIFRTIINTNLKDGVKNFGIKKSNNDIRINITYKNDKTDSIVIP